MSFLDEWMKGLRMPEGPAPGSASPPGGWMPRLETPRLILRSPRLGDGADLFRCTSDPEVARHCLWTAHRTKRETRRSLRILQAQHRAGEPSSYVIERREDRRVIGTIGYVRCEEEHRLAEVGYSLARDCWNQGFATEALSALLACAFGALGLHRVEAIHELDNPASGRVLEKCGFRREGILRGRVMNKGRWADVALWAILAEDRAGGATAEGRPGGG